MFFGHTLNKVKILLFISFLFVSFMRCTKDDTFNLRSSEKDYYYSTNNKKTADRLSKIMYNNTDSANPKERFKLVHISDAHLSSKSSSSNNYKSPTNLIEAVTFANQAELKIDAIAATGDHIYYAEKNKALSFMESFYYHLYLDNYVPTFPCYGNHDSNTSETSVNSYLNRAELYAAFTNYGNYILHRDIGKNYYFADVANPMGGTIRFIALDMLDQPAIEFNTLHDVVYSQEQINWLGNVALKKDMTDNHSIIILNHFPFQPQWGVYQTNEKFIHSWKLIPEIIEAFRKKEKITKSYKASGSLGESNRTFSHIHVDFDFNASPGEFICYLGGHAHITAQFSISGLDNQSPDLPWQQMFLCTNMSPSEKGEIFNMVERERYSLTDNSFCIYAIDTMEKNIYITFFGAYKPIDKPNYPEIMVINYL